MGLSELTDQNKLVLESGNVIDMRVLFITDPGTVGGATRSLIDVVSSMSNRGIECIVCTSTCNELNDELNGLNISNFASGHRAAMDIPAYKRWKRKLKKVIKGLDYHCSLPIVIKKIEKNINLHSIDLIHTNSARNDIGCILAKKYGIPHIMHIREFGKEDFECICYRRNYERFINSYTTRFIAISQAVKEAWVKKGISNEKITVIYNGVDNTRIVPAKQSDSKIETPLSMVIVGGVCEAKGQLQIIEAMGRLPSKIKDNVRLDIIGWGDPAYIEKINLRAAELGIGDKVHLLGARSDVYKLLQNYNIGLTCSRAEGFGRVTAEYMHARLGIIVSNTGANQELIQNEVNGLVYEYGKIDNLEECICRFYENRALLCELAKSAYNRARQIYTRERNTDSIYNMYLEICKQKGTEESGNL